MVGPRHATVGREWTDRDWVWIRTASAVVVAAVYYVAAVLWSSWYADDFLYLQLARWGELSPSWLAVDNYGKDLGLTLAHETEENSLQIALQKSETTDKKGLGYMSAEDIDKNLAVLSQMGLTSITKSTYTNELLDEIYKDGTNLLK